MTKFENPAVEEHKMFCAMRCDHISNSVRCRRILKKLPDEDRLLMLCKLMYGKWDYDIGTVWKSDENGRGTRYTYMDIEDTVRTTIGFEERNVGQWHLGEDRMWVIQSVNDFLEGAFDHE